MTDSTVIVSFDEAVNIGSSEFEIEEIGKSKKKQLSKDKRSVELLFTGKFTDSVFYTLYINIPDAVPNTLRRGSLLFGSECYDGILARGYL